MRAMIADCADAAYCCLSAVLTTAAKYAADRAVSSTVIVGQCVGSQKQAVVLRALQLRAFY